MTRHAEFGQISSYVGHVWGLGRECQQYPHLQFGSQVMYIPHSRALHYLSECRFQTLQPTGSAQPCWELSQHHAFPELLLPLSCLHDQQLNVDDCNMPYTCILCELQWVLFVFNAVLQYYLFICVACLNVPWRPAISDPSSNGRNLEAKTVVMTPSA